MKTAAKIIKARYMFYDEDIAQKDVELNGEQVRELINIARKEAIEECAKKTIGGSMKSENEIKQSILSLISELK